MNRIKKIALLASALTHAITAQDFDCKLVASDAPDLSARVCRFAVSDVPTAAFLEPNAKYILIAFFFDTDQDSTAYSVTLNYEHNGLHSGPTSLFPKVPVGGLAHFAIPALDINVESISVRRLTPKNALTIKPPK